MSGRRSGHACFSVAEKPPQTSENILDVDDRVVHDFAQSNDQSAQGDGIDRDAKPRKHDHGRQQRQRDGGQRYEGRADAAQQQDQHDGNQNATQGERMLHVVHGRLNERRWPVQPRVNFDPLFVQDRLHLGQGCFERSGGVHRVGAILARHRQEHARPPLDNSVAEPGLRAFNHMGEVLKTHAESIRMRDNHFPERFRAKRLAFGLQRDALVARLNEPCAHHAG